MVGYFFVLTDGNISRLIEHLDMPCEIMKIIQRNPLTIVDSSTKVRADGHWYLTRNVASIQACVEANFRPPFFKIGNSETSYQCVQLYAEKQRVDERGKHCTETSAVCSFQMDFAFRDKYIANPCDAEDGVEIHKAVCVEDRSGGHWILLITQSVEGNSFITGIRYAFPAMLPTAALLE